ncbi:unnamed protein product [Timema podura]|uniref:Uncharacterized protein n=1 Tax=Timema podura TaxID=61482 RepID=A0ABN7NMX7_TIMPD|nr:unnamed protein product [Timema podura]
MMQTKIYILFVLTAVIISVTKAQLSRQILNEDKVGGVEKLIASVPPGQSSMRYFVEYLTCYSTHISMLDMMEQEEGAEGNQEQPNTEISKRKELKETDRSQTMWGCAGFVVRHEGNIEFVNFAAKKNTSLLTDITPANVTTPARRRPMTPAPLGRKKGALEAVVKPEGKMEHMNSSLQVPVDNVIDIHEG